MTHDLPSHGCADCTGTSTSDTHVHRVPTLPPEGRGGHQSVTHGWATALVRGPDGGADWTFFADLEPAVAFGRAARMSADVTDWRLHQAARFNRAVDGRGENALFVADAWAGVQDSDRQAAVLHRWLSGCNPHNPAFVPPPPQSVLRRTGPRDRRREPRPVAP